MTVCAKPAGVYSAWINAKRMHLAHSKYLLYKSWRHVSFNMDPIHPPSQWALAALSPRVNRPGRDASHSPLNAEVKNEGSYTSTSPYTFIALQRQLLPLVSFWVILQHANLFGGHCTDMRPVADCWRITKFGGHCTDMRPVADCWRITKFGGHCTDMRPVADCWLITKFGGHCTDLRPVTDCWRITKFGGHCTDMRTVADCWFITKFGGHCTDMRTVADCWLITKFGGHYRHEARCWLLTYNKVWRSLYRHEARCWLLTYNKVPSVQWVIHF
jgi:hypothetical protein